MAKVDEKIMQIQTRIKVPKNHVNEFGNFKYRSAEDIMRALKPMEKELLLSVQITDEVVAVGANVYIRATVTVYDLESGESRSTSAFAREPAVPKAKMDESQTTGSASSYARKYALSGMFLLDDSIDPDSNRAIDSGEPCTDAQRPSGIWRSNTMSILKSCIKDKKLRTAARRRCRPERFLTCSKNSSGASDARSG